MIAVTRSNSMDALIGVGLYTPAEAGRLLQVPPPKIVRWMRGHNIGNKQYAPLWKPEIELGDERIFLGFRDLMEVRVANAFIKAGLSAIRVRAAIELAQEIIGQDHPLSTNRFRTDGREIFLQVIETDETGEQREKLLNLFRRQYEFKGIIDPILRTVDFDDDGQPMLWWPRGRQGQIVVDPARAFGQPIDSSSSVPTAILAAAARIEGVKGAAHAYEVSEASVVRSIEFEEQVGQRLAA
ncbi:hypothetical protein G6N73_08325 [Mesorhizobium camelthorni]|uniref:DUF433 domain-containing protein n=2 Tax=Allomesorhizobium camelthorni TaxID=475069 RepID=A0A6G4WA22_9HYPH|nr:hypothetical protein [Mesorhizobium camelthorni]